MPKNIKILFVDDDLTSIEYFKISFSDKYNILTAQSGEEGLDILQKHENIALILTDHRMPQMSGISFLKKSMKYSPDSKRILITGYSENDLVIRAINEGHIFYFIVKPWSFTDMSVAINNALETYNLRVTNKKLKLLNEQKERENIEVQLKNLQAQINPHFLFNCLTNLYALIDENKSAQLFVKKLSLMYRFMLEQKVDQLSDLGNEQRVIENYFYLQKVRFEEGLIVSNQVSENLEEFKIPSGTLLLLVENAIKHNIISQKHPLHVLIKNDQDFLYVINNYQPKADVISMGVGQQNIMKRYAWFTNRLPEFKTSKNHYSVKIPLLKQA
jgi:LytS/YehU family sensor histidine kinase